MVSKVQSMASISELMLGQNSKSRKKEEAVHLMANRKQRGSQQEGAGQDTAPEDVSKDRIPSSRLHL